MTPAQNTPLCAGDVELLREGDFCRRIHDGLLVTWVEQVPGHPCWFKDVATGQVWGGDPEAFTFLGRPDQEGWQKAEGTRPRGLPSDLMVETRRARQIIGVFRVSDFNWDLWCDWRPHVPSQAPAAPSPAPSLGVDLGELRRLAEAATQGPWYADITSARTYASVRRASGPHTRTGRAAIARLQTALNSQRAEEAKADAAYIAAANPQTILSLISHIEKLEPRS